MDNNFETLQLEKTEVTCRLCEDFAENALKSKTTAIVGCDGACVQGEIARKMANHLAYNINPDEYARICLGSAITKDTGQRKLLRNLKNLLIIEGCSVKCGSRLVKSVTHRSDMKIELISSYCDWNKNLFGMNEISNDELEKIATEGAQNYSKNIKKDSVKSSCCG
ncbi:MAG: hypothetical protein KBH06_03835 [Spirochaetes bacterium]|nr:hypothetical protein [Spirochaetota bacterium]MBP9022314.1 hypothetical protein [Spirochaetota bacterium]